MNGWNRLVQESSSGLRNSRVNPGVKKLVNKALRLSDFFKLEWHRRVEVSKKGSQFVPLLLCKEYFKATARTLQCLLRKLNTLAGRCG